VFLGDGRRT